MEGSGLRIRVDDRLRRDFISACKLNDQTASQVLRAFMREYVETTLDTKQQPLFDQLEHREGGVIKK